MFTFCLRNYKIYRKGRVHSCIKFVKYENSKRFNKKLLTFYGQSIFFSYICDRYRQTICRQRELLTYKE